jgi:uncharacterized protein YbjT (DUF2867 family)
MAAGSDAPVLVTGATGPHGRAVVEGLLAAGRAVRALTRDPAGPRAAELAELGAEPVAGDLLDADSLVAPMSGVAALYGVTTPFAAGAGDEVRQGEQLIEAARRAGVPWLVLASVASADRGTGIPHFESKWRIEQQLHRAGLPYTVVAPTYFYENLGAPAEVVAYGELALTLDPDRPLQQIALADLGALVAALLERRAEFEGVRLEVAGDDPTPREMAAALGVPYRRFPLAEVEERSADLAAMYRFLEDPGYQVDVPAVRARFPEVGWTSFAAWARQP